MTSTPPEMERLSVNVLPTTAATIRAISDARCSTITETIRRAVAVLELVEKAVREGGEVQIHEASGRVQVITLI